MTSLLLVTALPRTSAEVESMAASCGIRTRSVATYEAAREWLSMQTFDILLVDLAAEPLRGLDLLEIGWKYSAALTAGIFSLERPPADTWNATLLGAKVFIGPGALEKLHDFFSAFPKDVSLAIDKYEAVLLVEDLDSPRDIIQSYIQSLGYEHVDAVSGAAAALDKLAGNPQAYFCIVSDIHMPKMTGIELTAKVRQDPSLKNIPVIILTADPTAENVIECVRAGASGFLAKPPKKKNLLRELEKAKRMVAFRQSPRLCDPEDAAMLGPVADKMK